MTTNSGTKRPETPACSNTGTSFVWLKPKEDEGGLTGHDAGKAGQGHVLSAWLGTWGCEQQEPRKGLGQRTAASEDERRWLDVRWAVRTLRHRPKPELEQRCSDRQKGQMGGMFQGQSQKVRILIEIESQVPSWGSGGAKWAQRFAVGSGSHGRRE